MPSTPRRIGLIFGRAGENQETTGLAGYSDSVCRESQIIRERREKGFKRGDNNLADELSDDLQGFRTPRRATAWAR